MCERGNVEWRIKLIRAHRFCVGNFNRRCHNSRLHVLAIILAINKEQAQIAASLTFYRPINMLWVFYFHFDASQFWEKVKYTWRRSWKFHRNSFLMRCFQTTHKHTHACWSYIIILLWHNQHVINRLQTAIRGLQLEEALDKHHICIWQLLHIA